MKKKTMLATLVMLSLLQGTAFGEDWKSSNGEGFSLSYETKEYNDVDIKGTIGNDYQQAIMLNSGELTVDNNLAIDIDMKNNHISYDAIKFNGGVITVTGDTYIDIDDPKDENDNYTNDTSRRKNGVYLIAFTGEETAFEMGNNATINVKSFWDSRGIEMEGGTVTGGKLTITVDTTDYDSVASGLAMVRASNIKEKPDDVIYFRDTITMDIKAGNGDAYGINSKVKENLTFNAANGFDIKSTSQNGNAYGLFFQKNETADKFFNKKIEVGSGKLNVTAAKEAVGVVVEGTFTGDASSFGVLNLEKVESTGGKATGFKAAAKNDSNLQAAGLKANVVGAKASYGIESSNSSKTDFTGAVELDVKGAADSAVIKAEGGSTLNFKNGLKANATNGYNSDVYALQADGATVEASAGDVLLNGNISAENNANVKFAFNSTNGFTGATELADENSTINLDFKDSSRWNLMGDSELTTLAVAENAVVDMTADGGNYSKLTIDTLNDNGNNGMFKMDIDASMNTKNSDVLHITNHSGTHYIDLNIKDGDTSGAVGTVLASVVNETGSFAANDKENALFWECYELTKETENVTEGYTADWILSAVTKDEEKGTTSVDTILGANALNYHTWRAENDQLMRRMGELRNNGADEEGAWFRVHGSKINRDDSMSFENKYTTYELGYDQVTKQTEDMTRYTGAALSYTDGSSSYDSGNGENHSKALSFYNTDLYRSGHYLDLVFKYANMDNDFNVYDTNNNKISGEYKNTGISVSAEYGRKNNLQNGWYVEPQAQLTLGYFGGDEYETSNGISVDQSGIASVLGRVGFNIGKQIGNSGVIYAKANLLHEFAGDYDIDMYDGAGNHRAESASFNDTWFEYGVGAALKTGKNNHLYFDFVKTAGGDFEKDWQWNAGMRWTF